MAMHYRRFGRTGLKMPVLTCGGMRYQQAWKDDDPALEIDPDNQANLEATVRAAVAAGITHIETARGYGTSEIQLGRVLPSFPRASILVQTKIGPAESEDDFLRTFDQCMRNLRLDYLDLLGIHGINTADLLDLTLHKGTLKAAQRLRDEGRVRHIGFSTHGPCDVIVAAIETGEFEYVNLHWYYFDPRNSPAIDEAARRDMGVFIISPSDKGGRLYAPPPKLVELCQPFTPMGFNDLFCLSRPDVHTLSIGASRPSDFDAHLAVMPELDRASDAIRHVVVRLESEMRRVLGDDWCDGWAEALPSMEATPGEVPLYHVLRLYNLAMAYDMEEFGRMRYNLLGSGGHWFPGNKVDKMDWAALREVLRNHPLAERIEQALKIAHERFNAADEKRLSES